MSQRIAALLTGLLITLTSFAGAEPDFTPEPPKPAAADPTPAGKTSENHFHFRPFSAEYTLKKGGLSLGNAKFTLRETSPGTWHYKSSLKPTGLARMFTSDAFSEETYVLQQADGTLVPQGYSYTRTGNEPETASVNYDWDSHTAYFTRNGKGQQLTLTPEHQDRYSLVLSLMQAIATGADNMSYQVIDKSMKSRGYRRDITEVTRTGLGDKQSIRVIQSGNSKRQIHYWLSPELNYLPVRIEQFRKGKSQLKMVLQSLEWE